MDSIRKLRDLVLFTGGHAFNDIGITVASDCDFRTTPGQGPVTIGLESNISHISGRKIVPGTFQTIVIDGGTLNVEADGSVIFNPYPDFEGTVKFTYATSDDHIRTVKGVVDSVDPEKFNKWLSVWTLGLLGELGEVIEVLQRRCYSFDNVAREVGDVCWYTMALSMLLGDNYDFSGLSLKSKYFGLSEVTVTEGLFKGLEFSEKVKKFVRDYPERGTVDNVTITGFEKPITLISPWFPLAIAIDAVDVKLRERFRTGFSASASVNR